MAHDTRLRLTVQDEQTGTDDDLVLMKATLLDKAGTAQSTTETVRVAVDAAGNVFTVDRHTTFTLIAHQEAVAMYHEIPDRHLTWTGPITLNTPFNPMARRQIHKWPWCIFHVS